MKRMDGAGHAKMATLDAAIVHIQRIHGAVERMAIAVRSNADTTALRQQVHRAASPLVGLLKGQFGMIAEQVSSLMLVLSRGGGDQARLRALREHVAQIRAALEISIAKVKELHTTDDSDPASPRD